MTSKVACISLICETLGIWIFFFWTQLLFYIMYSKFNFLTNAYFCSYFFLPSLSLPSFYSLFSSTFFSSIIFFSYILNCKVVSHLFYPFFLVFLLFTIFLKTIVGHLGFFFFFLSMLFGGSRQLRCFRGILLFYKEN